MQNIISKGLSKITKNLGSREKIVVIGSHQVRFQRKLAEGGYSFVYVVEDIHTGQEFALKRVLTQDSESETLVRREISLMQDLRHANIVKFYGYTENMRGMGKEFMILLEYCRRGHLIQYIEQRQGDFFKERDMLEMFLQVCRAVRVLHDQDTPIAHRDLKVENLLLSDDGSWKLCDFGSCTTRAKAYKSRSEIGREEENIQKYTTAMYRAPEMVDLHSHQLVNERVDIWALGCILYTMAFFKHPFPEGSNLQIIGGNYDVPERHQYSKSLTELIRLLLTINPRKRPSIRHVIEHVEKLIRGEEGTLLKRLKGLEYRSKSQQRKNRTRSPKKTKNRKTPISNEDENSSSASEGNPRQGRKRPSKSPTKRRKGRHTLSPPSDASSEDSKEESDDNSRIPCELCSCMVPHSRYANHIRLHEASAIDPKRAGRKNRRQLRKTTYPLEKQRTHSPPAGRTPEDNHGWAVFSEDSSDSPPQHSPRRHTSSPNIVPHFSSNPLSGHQTRPRARGNSPSRPAPPTPPEEWTTFEEDTSVTQTSNPRVLNQYHRTRADTSPVRRSNSSGRKPNSLLQKYRGRQKQRAGADDRPFTNTLPLGFDISKYKSPEEHSDGGSSSSAPNSPVLHSRSRSPLHIHTFDPSAASRVQLPRENLQDLVPSFMKSTSLPPRKLLQIRRRNNKPEGPPSLHKPEGPPPPHKPETFTQNIPPRHPADAFSKPTTQNNKVKGRTKKRPEIPQRAHSEPGRNVSSSDSDRDEVRSDSGVKRFVPRSTSDWVSFDEEDDLRKAKLIAGNGMIRAPHTYHQSYRQPPTKSPRERAVRHKQQFVDLNKKTDIPKLLENEEIIVDLPI